MNIPYNDLIILTRYVIIENEVISGLKYLITLPNIRFRVSCIDIIESCILQRLHVWDVTKTSNNDLGFTFEHFWRGRSTQSEPYNALTMLSLYGTRFVV